MIEDLIKTPMFRRVFPPIAGAIFVAVFASLGLWQLDRAAEKNALLRMFEGETPYARVSDFASLAEFVRIQTDGEFLPDRQILVDNIVREGRPGYYVITPFRLTDHEPLLLVNRGWTPKAMTANASPPELAVLTNRRTVRGLVGRLPRVAIRQGEAFEGGEDWPRVAVYPRLNEVATALDVELLPMVLLLAPDEPDGFFRSWQPNISGPMTHYGYAVQWFAMATTVIVLFFWHLKKRRRRE